MAIGLVESPTTTPAVDYPTRTTYQPDEPPLETSVDQLRDLHRAVGEIGDRPGRHVYPDFIVHHGQRSARSVLLVMPCGYQLMQHRAWTGINHSF